MQQEQQEVEKRTKNYEAEDGNKPFLLKNKKSILIGEEKKY